MDSSTAEIIREAVQRAQVKDFTGTYKELGHGELNQTYLLDCTSGALVLRIAKHQDQSTLKREAHALSVINKSWAPQLVYFNADQKMDGRLWILETYIEGGRVTRLSPEQFFKLGTILAQIHQHGSSEAVGPLWAQLLHECSSFGDEHYLLAHPEPRLKEILNEAKQEFAKTYAHYEHGQRSLIHSDATPSNILVTDEGVALIDWELAQYKDPMAEFSTVYYEDIEYNQGKWRLKITSEEKSKLFAGYEAGGGKIDEERIQFWIRFDKIGAAVFLWWRLHESGRHASVEDTEQYNLDLNNLLTSLEK